MHQADNAYMVSCKESLIKYLHQCLFCPPKTTLLAAITNNRLATWPGLTARAVEWYLLDHAPATNKGHMKRHKKGIRTTKQRMRDDLEAIEVKKCINPIYLRVDAWKKTIFATNLSGLPNTVTCINTGRIKIAVDMAVADAGAMGYLCYQVLQ